MLNRRQVIKTGIAGGLLLVTARVVWGPFSGGGVLLLENGDNYIFLTQEDRAVIASLAPVILEGALPDDVREYDSAISEIVKGVDTTISGLTPSVQKEVRELFGILTFPVTRTLLASVWKPWLEADRVDIENFLSSWQNSRFNLLRSAYDALHELITASWYGNKNSWNGIGYAGPPDIGV